MKVAKKRAASWFIECPHCGDSLCEPRTGSVLWLDEDIERTQGPVKCANCGKPFGIPTP